MFHTLQNLTDASVFVMDGRIGAIRNVLFDDQSWMVRFFVVDLNGWLTRCELVLAANAVDQPDWQKKVVRAHITKMQAQQSPDLASTKRVARQQKLALREYYRGPATDGFAGEFRVPLSPAAREYALHAKEDPHLRSTNGVWGCGLWNKSEFLGQLEDFVLDDHSWFIKYLEVKSTHWLSRRSFLIATTDVESVSWVTHRVNLRAS